MMLSAVMFLTYLAGAWCVQRIAGRLRVPHGWMAWVPFINLYLLCRLAGLRGWWVAGWLVPIANLLWLIWLWRRVLARLGRRRWPAVLIPLPVVSLLVIGYAALAKPAPR